MHVGILVIIGMVYSGRSRWRTSGIYFYKEKVRKGTEGKSAGQREDDPGNVHEHGTQTFRGTDQTGDAVHEQCKVTAEMPFSFWVI